MKKSHLILLLGIVMGTSSLYASELAIVTDKNVVGGNLKVSVLNHSKYDYESISLYQESIDGQSTLLGNYAKGSLNNTLVPLNLAYKRSVVKGVVSNHTILNSGSEVYIKSNLPYYAVEGNPIEWGYLFDGLGTPTSVKWTVSSYDESNKLLGVVEYDKTTPPKLLNAGTHIVKLEYSDIYGEEFVNTKAVKIMQKIDYKLDILLGVTIKDTEDTSWNYSFDGVTKEINWYIDGELQTILPNKLPVGTHIIKLEVVTDLDEVYSVTKQVNVVHVKSLDDLTKGSVPEGTKISTTAPTYEGNVNNLINGTMYNGDWSTSGYYADLVLEFPYAINIDMFEIGKQSVPPCNQSITLTGYRKDGTKIKSSDALNFYSYDIRNFSEDELLQEPQKIYISWDNIGIGDCTKLVISFDSKVAWGCLRYLGFGYTQSESTK